MAGRTSGRWVGQMPSYEGFCQEIAPPESPRFAAPAGGSAARRIHLIADAASATVPPLGGLPSCSSRSLAPHRALISTNVCREAALQ